MFESGGDLDDGPFYLTVYRQFLDTGYLPMKFLLGDDIEVNALEIMVMFDEWFPIGMLFEEIVKQTNVFQCGLFDINVSQLIIMEIEDLKLWEQVYFQREVIKHIAR